MCLPLRNSRGKTPLKGTQITSHIKENNDLESNIRLVQSSNRTYREKRLIKLEKRRAFLINYAQRTLLIWP